MGCKWNVTGMSLECMWIYGVMHVKEQWNICEV